MAVLDVETLLAPVSEEEPCGPNLEYDDVFTSFEQAARGKAEQQYGDTIIPAEAPDWREVRRLGSDLVTRTRDLRVGCMLARGLLETDGLSGFAEALALVRGYLERYWDTMHPRLDPEDDNDPTLRVNTISSLSDQATTIRALRMRPMVSARAIGQFSLRDLAVAAGEIPPSPDEEPAKQSTIEAAFLECDLNQLKSDTGAVRGCLASAEAIESVVTDQVGAANAVSLEGLRTTLQEMLVVMEEYVARREPVNEDTSGGEGGAPGVAAEGTPSAGRLSGEVRSRQDVLTALDRICQYYERNEPSSPVPLLLKRAKRLASKTFLEIVRDLTPDAVSQIEALGGVSGGDSEE
jgi:type VI secretion system protein ImpA